MFFLGDRQKHFSIEDIKSNHSFKRYGFLVKDALKFREEIPYLGKLGFFEVSDLRYLRLEKCFLDRYLNCIVYLWSLIVMLPYLYMI